MARFVDALGTVFTKFQVGLGAAGLVLKVTANKFRARNVADTVDAPLVGSVIAASGDSIQLNEDALGAGADWLMSLNRPATGMTAAVNFTFPATVGTAGQAMTIDGSSGQMAWTTVAAGSDKMVVDTTNIAFGTISPLTLFTLPANAVVEVVRVIVGTPFNGAPAVSIGIAGTTSKYMGATQVDLMAAANTVFEVAPGVTPVGTTEALIATYSGGGATVGAGRIEIDYVVPN